LNFSKVMVGVSEKETAGAKDIIESGD